MATTLLIRTIFILISPHIKPTVLADSCFIMVFWWQIARTTQDHVDPAHFSYVEWAFLFPA
jgi:hypothetical protein